MAFPESLPDLCSRGHRRGNAALGRLTDLYVPGQIPEYRDIVDTIIAWGKEILANHTSRRASLGPLEGINKLLQVLRRGVPTPGLRVVRCDDPLNLVTTPGYLWWGSR